MNCKAVFGKRYPSGTCLREGDDLFYTLHIGALSDIIGAGNSAKGDYYDDLPNRV